MSELLRDTSVCVKKNEPGPDYLGYYKHFVLELLSQNEDFFVPFSGLDSDPSVEVEGLSRDDSKSREVNMCSGSVSLFAGEICEGLPDYKKERLKALLNQSIVGLNQEADEILDYILAIFQIEADMRGKALLSCHSSASDEDMSELLCSKKRKPSSTSPISTYFECCDAMPNSHSVRQVYKDIEDLLENDEIHPEEALKKYSDGIYAKLGKMELELEKFLNVLGSKCRPMTRSEKQQLGRRIHKLPTKALDRVVEIIKLGNFPPSHISEIIQVNLEEQDDATLWRLYYYVEMVVKANKL